MRYLSYSLASCSIVLMACDDTQRGQLASQQSAARQAAFERHTAEYDRQQAEAARQLEEGDKELRRAAAQNDRIDQLLRKWEDQASRHDRLLDRWERLATTLEGILRDRPVQTEAGDRGNGK